MEGGALAPTLHLRWLYSTVPMPGLSICAALEQNLLTAELTRATYIHNFSNCPEVDGAALADGRP
jgi:hypothetical protein